MASFAPLSGLRPPTRPARPLDRHDPGRRGASAPRQLFNEALAGQDDRFDLPVDGEGHLVVAGIEHEGNVGDADPLDIGHADNVADPACLRLIEIVEAVSHGRYARAPPCCVSAESRPKSIVIRGECLQIHSPLDRRQIDAPAKSKRWIACVDILL
jgi:hypothetical protein